MPGPTAKNKGRQRSNAITNHPVSLDPTPDSLAEVPPPSPKWLAVTKKSWAAYWDSAVARAVVSSDLPALRRLFQLRDVEERLMRLAEAEGFMTYGSTGQPVAHPALRQADTLRTEIRNLETQFGLTPASRARLGIDTLKVQRTLADLAVEATLPDPATDPRNR